ncbi:hypothetical protein [Kitasatospora sp. NPDC056531]|uniref:hypothetical protein n=1 Tax=Kitasatospora sp. NPDC056531 TaxID=3345856 RepID=UPI0036C74ED7
MVAEPDPSLALAQRAGWLQVVEWVASGQIGAVVTMNRQMVSNSPQEWACLAAELHAQGVELRTLASIASPRGSAV